MNIAEYQIIPIETGRFRLDGGAFFGVVPKPLWEQKIPSDDKNRVELALRCLLLKGRNKNILIDCGIYRYFSEKEKEIYAIDFSEYSFSMSLNNAGLSKDEITHVILTHFHFDHAGGAVELDEMGIMRPTFRNALYYIQRKNYDWANNPSEYDHKSYTQNIIKPLTDSKRLRIISGSIELFPNIDVMVYNGHTIGQQLVKISDRMNTLLYCADLVPSTAHLFPHWVMAYDLQPLVTIQEKKKLLHEACKKQWILFFEHDPIIEACTIQTIEKGYAVRERVHLN